MDIRHETPGPSDVSAIGGATSSANEGSGRIIPSAPPEGVVEGGATVSQGVADHMRPHKRKRSKDEILHIK